MTATTSTVTVDELVACARAAHEQQQRENAAADEAREREIVERNRTILIKHAKEYLGVDLDVPEGTDEVALPGGMRLRASGGGYDESKSVYLVRACPNCGGAIVSHSLWDLATLGRALASDSGHWFFHACLPSPDATPAPPPTTEQLLLDALRAFIAENSNQGAY